MSLASACAAAVSAMVSSTIVYSGGWGATTARPYQRLKGAGELIRARGSERGIWGIASRDCGPPAFFDDRPAVPGRGKLLELGPFRGRIGPVVGILHANRRPRPNGAAF